jgi:hypothetical protein
MIPFFIRRCVLLSSPFFLMTALWIPAVWGTEAPAGDRPHPSKPSPEETQSLERSLDEALNALAESMQNLSLLVERGHEKFQRCRSGVSTEAWCAKMRKALKRLERLENSMNESSPKNLP